MDNSSASSVTVAEKPIGNVSLWIAPPVKSDQLPAGKRLTKDLVLSKSKGGSLLEIKKIVVWGQNITDCSIVTEIPDLEVASMNANKISSLEHFGQCPNLRELFLRSNCIENIHEIYFLKDLPNLQVLWLAGNPCTKHLKYRSTVIRNLEQLQKLDDTEISQVERAASESDGLLFEQPPAPGSATPDTDAETAEDATAAADSPLPIIGDLAERMRPAEDVPVAGGSAAEATAAPAAETAPLEAPQQQPQSGCSAVAAVGAGDGAAAVTATSEKPAEASATACSASTGIYTAAATLSASRPCAASAATTPPLPGYALTEVRTAVLRLIRLLDQESLQLVLLTVRSRLEKEAPTSEAQQPPPPQQQQAGGGPEISTSFSLDNL